ncbi:hypothetical protein BH11BAC7_BH11BAC7_09070 [soil metagenome]
MRSIEQILFDLERCLNTGTYKQFETDRLELKDLSGGDDWRQLYISVCAFLNTKGGTIIIGVNENVKDKLYRLTGYKGNSEEKLKQLPTLFTNETGVQIKLDEYLSPRSFDVRHFMEKEICVLTIPKLPEDMKYVFYKGNAYERQLTGDKKIDEHRIKNQQILRAEFTIAQELQPVTTATIRDINIDKLNDYIVQINRDTRIETVKADIKSALPFLIKRKFIIDERPTLLGVLICGDNISDIIGAKCEVDGYVEGAIGVATNKKVLKDNIIPLMEKSISFIISNIATGISLESGGTTVYEYPERLIRETVNNALAHRDYNIDRFVTIVIRPNRNIEIRNPGHFDADQIINTDDGIRIRRIIPNPKPKNPKLADILKTFDRMEARGLGMASLTDESLENRIDLPYYFIHQNSEVGLVIPKGRVLDEEMELWLKSFEKFILNKMNQRILSEEQKTVLAYFYKTERHNKLERFTIHLTPDNNHFKVISDLEIYGLIYKHSKFGEQNQYPIFLVDRILLKDDFYDNLRQIFRNNFDILGQEHKDVLNTIYHLNEFSAMNGTNATVVGEILFLKAGKRKEETEVYNSYQRRIRNVINQLSKRNYIINKGGSTRPNYYINNDFGGTEAAFSDNDLA